MLGSLCYCDVIKCVLQALKQKYSLLEKAFREQGDVLDHVRQQLDQSRSDARSSNLQVNV